MIGSQKIYYPISEVCDDTGLEQHVLRYWETEFSQLRPKKNRAGNRAYRAKDIQLIKLIKHLLYDEHFTIMGAKKRLAELKDFSIDTQMKLPIAAVTEKKIEPVNIGEIRKELQAVLKILTKK